MLKEYPKCLVCDEYPNRKRVNALMAGATMYDSTPFDSKDPVVVSETEVYCCTECYTRGVVTQEDALDALWNRTVIYS
jgi:nitrate reductase cytochrome c-type subunit